MDIISVIAIVVAAASFLLAWRADRRAARAERRGRQGQPIVIPYGGSASDENVVCDYAVRNDGQATITYFLLWIVDAEGETISTGAGGDRVVAPGSIDVVAVNLLHPQREGELVIRWRDADGEHEQPTGITVPAQT